MLENTEKKVYTISQLTRDIKYILESSLDNVWITGEISNFRIPASGHFYFTLKDEDSQIRAVMFKFQNRDLRFEPKDGLIVMGWGKVSVYEKRGEYQVILEYMEPRGIGALQLAFEQLKAKLFNEGLFDDNKKRSLPLLPGKIGVVTSATGAAFYDILNVIHRRYANVEILLYPVSVQGEEASSQIVQAIYDLNRKFPVDVIIVGRGGGSIEDLWAFNEEIVARAIFASKIPIISAVGHEIDYTISDFVADLRAPTPSAAAELAVIDKDKLKSNLDELSSRLSSILKQRIEISGERLKSLKLRLSSPQSKIIDFSLWIDDLSSLLMTGFGKLIGRKKERVDIKKEGLLLRSPEVKIEAYRKSYYYLQKELKRNTSQILERKFLIMEKGMEKLASLNPLTVLRRGYSIARRVSTGEIIKDAVSVKAGEGVMVKLHRGELLCQVEEVIH